MNNNSINSITNLTASGTITSGTITSGTITTNNVTTSSALLNIKSDLVLFKGNDNSIYLDAHPGGVLCWTDFYTDGIIKSRGGYQ